MCKSAGNSAPHELDASGGRVCVNDRIAASDEGSAIIGTAVDKGLREIGVGSLRAVVDGGSCGRT